MVDIRLGKAVRGEDGTIRYFHRGGSLPNSRQLEPTRALWKFLADHAEHPLRVLMPGVPEYERLDDFVEIGGDRIVDIPFEEYLRDWPG
jgi:hypothetical protein